MSPIASLAEKMLGAAINNFFTERDKRGQQVLQVHHLGATGFERNRVSAERRLQRGKAIKLIEDDVGHGIAPQFDDDAIAVPVGFVAQRCDALDLFVADQFANPLHQVRLVDLVRDLAHDNGFTLAA